MRLIPFGKPILGEEEKTAVWAVMESGILAHGEKIGRFEQVFANFTGASHAVGVANCTAALHLAYFCLGIGSGDEVIVPAHTHVATAHAVELVGARPVFVDAECRTGNIDLDRVEEEITPNTKAISIVHFLGMPVAMDRLMAIARKHDLRIIEDCALALGATYKGVHVGLFGDAGCFSFYPVKHITTAEGGMLITRNKELAQAVTKARAFGMDKHVGERKMPGMYDVLSLGFNYRLNEIQATLGIEQMKRIEGFLRKRRENYTALAAGLKGVEGIELFSSSHDDFQNSCYCLSIMLNDVLASKRTELIESLKRRGVGTSIYYPQPVPRMSYYREKYGYNEKKFPVAEKISDQSIALSVGPHLTSDDIFYMVDCVKEIISEEAL